MRSNAAGIGSQVYASGSTVTKYFYPWFEWYPEPEIQITNFPVSPGDMIEVLLCAQPGAGATSATVYLTNIVSGAHTSVTFDAPGTTKLVGNCAEWVVEAPTVGGQQSAIADFGEVFFSVCESYTHSGTLVYGGTGDNINMENGAGQVVVDGNLITSSVIQCLYT